MRGFFLHRGLVETVLRSDTKHKIKNGLISNQDVWTDGDPQRASPGPHLSRHHLYTKQHISYTRSGNLSNKPDVMFATWCVCTCVRACVCVRVCVCVCAKYCISRPKPVGWLPQKYQYKRAAAASSEFLQVNLSCLWRVMTPSPGDLWSRWPSVLVTPGQYGFIVDNHFLTI